MAKLVINKSNFLGSPFFSKDKKQKIFNSLSGFQSNLLKNKYGELVFFDNKFGIKLNEDFLKGVKKTYKAWKSLNEERNKISRSKRVTNLPEEISEGLVCYYCNYYLHLETKSNIPLTYDIFNESKTSQVKGSCSNAPSSFSVKETTYDVIHYFNLDINTDHFQIYEIPKSVLSTLKITADKTFTQQREEGKRPKVNIMESIVIPYNIKPVAEGKL